MSGDISDEAYFRCAINTGLIYITRPKGLAVQIGLDTPGGYESFQVTEEEARAAQAELDAKREVTDEAVRAAYNVHNSASEHCKFSTDFERCKAAIEAALKVMR